MTKIIDGKALRDKIIKELAQEVKRKNIRAVLAIVLVGEDQASLRYISQKQKAASEIGAETKLIQLDKGISQEELNRTIEQLNKDSNITGIIVQLPLPSHLNKEQVLELINKEKDVDGLTSNSPFAPATPAGIMEILHEYKVPIENKTVVVLGQSQLVGAPLSSMLEKEGAKVTRIDINTPPPIAPLVQQGDIVVVAVGKINLVTADMVKPGAVVIDVGTNITPEGKLVGDVDFEKVKDKASLITPVPGGVGPMTVASLMKNLVTATSLDK
jgi:methylenetetrahydrofolate dehydrogenase (NADP+)/methenyltetrahydrofolate cyclohydrolase